MSRPPQKSRKRRSEDSAIGSCILCHLDCDEDRNNTNLDAWNNLKEHAKQWVGLDIFGSVYDEVVWENGSNGVYFHQNCKLNLFNSRKLKQALSRKEKCHAENVGTAAQMQTDPSSSQGPIETGTRQTRSITGLVHDKNLCIWCMKPEDQKHRGRDKWHIMQQLNAWYAFKSHTVYLEDLTMRERLLTFIESTSDPFAVEIRYHRTCWVKYISATSDTGKDDPNLHLQHVHLSEVKEMWFKHIRNVVLEQHELRTLQSLLQDYIQMLRNFGMNVGVVKSCTIKTMIQEEFHDRIGFHERYQKNHSALVYDTYSGGSYAEAAINCWGVTDDQLISTVAQRINAHASQAQVMSWPPHVDELVDSEDSDELLYKFVTLLKKPKAGEDQKDPAVLALTSLLTSYITGKRTSFKVKLAVTLHGLTRSREIIDLMHKFSLGISYKDVLNLYDAWAKFDIETNRACPDELAMGQPGTAVMDNDDFKDDTLTGANTSHRTNVMFVQPQDLVETSAVSRQSLSIPTADDMKALCASQHLVQPYKTVQRGTPSIRLAANIDAPYDTNMQRKRSLIHVLARLDENMKPRVVSEQTVGAFAGFQASVQPSVVKSKPYYFLTFPNPPHKSVVHEVMKRLVLVAIAKNMPFIQLVGDQPVYTLIVQIRYEHPDQFNIILPCMGPFHIHCSFIYAIDKRFHGSGLSDVLVMAGVIAEGSVDQALRGKHYKRSIRCLRLMYEALMRRLILYSLCYGASVPEDVKCQLVILRDPSSSFQECEQSYALLESNPNIITIVAEEFERITNSGTPMAKYWMSFLEMTEILMMNLHALRTQNWEEFKASLRLMLPWMQIYDNSKYGRWMVEYWLELSNLPEERTAYMRDGLFSQSITGKPYSCLPLDLWIEMTMNKGSKMKAGWLKILKNEKMLLTDSRNVNSVNQVRSSLHTMAQSTLSKQQHSENTKTRLKLDEQAVQDIDSCITEFSCDPFNTDNPNLRSLQSGVLASTALVDDFESAHHDGEDLFRIFCNDRMLSDNIPFYSTVHRNSRRNFSNPPPVIGDNTDKVTKSEAMENKAMASIIALAEAHDDKFNLINVMEYRVTDECLPIYNVNGTMRKTQKSKLVDKLYMETLDSKEYIAIVDMGFIWRLSTPSFEDREQSDGTSFTWRDYASKMLSIIMSRHKNASKIVLVNDRYDLPFTIKDSERNLRSSNIEGSKNIFIRPSDKFPSARAFQDLLHNPANKQRLQSFLQDEIRLRCCEHPNVQFVYSVGPKCWNLSTGDRIGNFECEHIEADTILFFIYSQIRRSGIDTDVVIDAEDTDVLVLSAYVAHTIDGVLAVKRKKNIIDCKKLCSKEVAEIIVQLHIHSGSDTTTAFFGHGKASIFTKGISDDARALLCCFGKSLPVTQSVLNDMAIFTLRYIYNDKVSKSMGEARARKWNQMKRKSTLRLPPDRDSHDLKVTRGNYQTHMLLNYHKVDPSPSPLSHGWAVENGLCKPVRYTRPALPMHLKDVVQLQDLTPGDTDSGESDSYDEDEDNDIDV